MGKWRAYPTWKWLAVVAVLSAVMCVTAAVAAETVLRVAMPGDLKQLDPIWTTAHITRNHGYMVYDTLFSMDAKGRPQPQMVDTWTVSQDKLIYRFTLRTGLNWHDGAPVRAADCVASLKRWGQKDSLGRMLWAKVKSINTRDDKTFEIVLKEPFGLIVDVLGEVSGNVPFMMPERLAVTPPDQQVEDPTGSGPFIMKKTEWVPGSKAVYVKNPNYRPRPEPANGLAGGKAVHVDRVEWLYIPDAGTAQAALMSGEIDFFLQPQNELLPILARDPNIVIEILDTSGSQGIFRMNHLHPPFNNVKAREAMLWMINQEEYLKIAVGDSKYYKVCAAMFMCGSPLESEVGAEALKRQDLNKARQLLKESGYDGRPIVVIDPTDATNHHKAALLTAENLRKIGAKVDVQAMDLAMMMQRRAVKKPVGEGGWNIFHTDFQGVDLSNPLTNRPLESQCDQSGWPGWPCNESVERLKTQFAAESDPGKRREIATKIQAEAMRHVTHGWIGQYFKPSAYRNDLKGLLQGPIPVFWNVKKQ